MDPFAKYFFKKTLRTRRHWFVLLTVPKKLAITGCQFTLRINYKHPCRRCTYICACGEDGKISKFPTSCCGNDVRSRPIAPKQKAISSSHLGCCSSSFCQKNSKTSPKWMCMTGLQFAAKPLDINY